MFPSSRSGSVSVCRHAPSLCSHCPIHWRIAVLHSCLRGHHCPFREAPAHSERALKFCVRRSLNQHVTRVGMGHALGSVDAVQLGEPAARDEPALCHLYPFVPLQRLPPEDLRLLDTHELGCRAPLQKEQGSLCPFCTGKPKQRHVKGFFVSLWMQKLLVGQQALYLHVPGLCWTRRLLLQPDVPP